MTTKKHILFIVNPISGTSRKQSVGESIGKAVDGTRFDYSIVATRYGGHAYEIAREAVRSGLDAVVAVGGDGTVNEVGRAVAGSATRKSGREATSGEGVQSARTIAAVAPARKAAATKSCPSWFGPLSAT